MNRSVPPCGNRQRLSKKRILIVNCYLDEVRWPIRRTNKIPQAMAPAYLAGAFSRKLCNIRLYSELPSGPLEDEALLGWPDMLILTGLITSFDRMLHLTGYARTKNPRVVVVAGGPAIRALPRLAKRFFDYSCTGDVEQIKEVIRDVFGEAYIAENMIPRFDLAYWTGRIGYVETSRNCNFHCSFCTLTGEGRNYQQYDLDAIRKQILAAGKRELLVFLDNNFYGNDRNYFLARLELIKALWKAGLFGGWVALVTNDFFWKHENLTLAKAAGCQALFCGVESFDVNWLLKFKKAQNTRVSQVDMIRMCLEVGILFFYGLMLDPITRTIADLRSELDFVTGTPEISLPSYLSVPVPIPATPFFYECLRENAFLPLTKLRDLDSTTLTLKTLDPINRVASFLDEIQYLRGYRQRIWRHTVKFMQRYGSGLNRNQLLIVLGNAGLLCIPKLVTSPNFYRWRTSRQRTYISTTELEDKVYSPAFPVASRYQLYFSPTMLTGANGHLTDEMCELTEQNLQIKALNF